MTLAAKPRRPPPSPSPPAALTMTTTDPDTLPERTALALEDYELSASRGHVRSSTDVLDIAARWTTTDFNAPVSDAAAWADFDSLQAAVYSRHRERQAAGW